jgi:hypothetical protein
MMANGRQRTPTVKPTFSSFIYNKQAGTFLGRNGKSWCMSLSFAICAAKILQKVAAKQKLAIFDLCILFKNMRKNSIKSTKKIIPYFIHKSHLNFQSKSSSSTWSSTPCWRASGSPA